MEDGVEGPGADAVAPTFREVEEEHGEVAEEVAHQEHHPAVDINDDACRKAAACRRRRHRRHNYIINIAKECCTLHPEMTAVKQGVAEGGAEDDDDLEGLRELEPEEGDEDGDGVVEEVVVQFEAASSSSSLEHEEGEQGAGQLKEAREVEEVGPEEDPAGGPGAQREAEKPLQRGPGPPP